MAGAGAPSRVISLLQPFFQGDWAPYGRTLLATLAPAQAVPVAHLLRDPRLLADTLLRHAAHLGVPDLRVAASVWSLRYLWALLPPAVAAASALGRHVPVATAQISVCLDAQGGATCFYLLDPGAPCSKADTATRFAPLMEHLHALVAALGSRSRIAPKILWGNVARYLDAIFGEIIRHAPCPASVRRDRAWLLDPPVLSDGSHNPLYGRQREALRVIDGVASPIILHRQCCLCYLLPREDYCLACPLAPRHRATPRADDA